MKSRKLTSKKFIRQWTASSRLAAFVVIVAIAGIGTYLLLGSHAATPSTSTAEAESGTKSGTTSAITDSSASGGSALQFGTVASSGSGNCNASTSPGPMPTAVPSGYTRAFTEDWNTNAAEGSFDSTYGYTSSQQYQWDNYNGSTPGGYASPYDNTKTLSVSNGSLYAHMRSINGTPYAFAMQPIRAGQQSGYLNFTYGTVDWCFKLDSATSNTGYGVVALLWPGSGDWTNEIDFPETRTSLTGEISTASMITNQSGTFANLTDLPSGSDGGGILPVKYTDNKYHDFRLEWASSTSLKAYVDGQLVCTYPANSVPAQPMHVVLQAATKSSNSSDSATFENAWMYINTKN